MKKTRIITVLSGFILGAAAFSPVEAKTEPDPSLIYRVVRVSKDDKLNVRDYPGVKSSIVGGFEPGSPVLVSGLSRTVSRAVWWQVLYKSENGEYGWVNSRFLAADESRERDSAFPLRCIGNEPFWAITIAGNRATFSLMGEEEESWRASDWINSMIRPEGYRFAVRLLAGKDKADGWAAISRSDKACSDKMSDNKYPFDVIVVLPGGERVLDGCCFRAPPCLNTVK